MDQDVIMRDNVPTLASFGVVSESAFDFEINCSCTQPYRGRFVTKSGETGTSESLNPKQKRHQSAMNEFH